MISFLARSTAQALISFLNISKLLADRTRTPLPSLGLKSCDSLFTIGRSNTHRARKLERSDSIQSVKAGDMNGEASGLTRCAA